MSLDFLLSIIFCCGAISPSKAIFYEYLRNTVRLLTSSLFHTGVLVVAILLKLHDSFCFKGT